VNLNGTQLERVHMSLGALNKQKDGGKYFKHCELSSKGISVTHWLLFLVDPHFSCFNTATSGKTATRALRKQNEKKVPFFIY